MIERRRLVRKDSSLKGEILREGAATLGCIVTNVSPIGAKVSLAGDAEVPDVFHLRAAELGLDVQARVVWRTQSELGVRFPLVASAASAHPGEPAAEPDDPGAALASALHPPPRIARRRIA